MSRTALAGARHERRHAFSRSDIRDIRTHAVGQSGITATARVHTRTRAHWPRSSFCSPSARTTTHCRCSDDLPHTHTMTRRVVSTRFTHGWAATPRRGDRVRCTRGGLGGAHSINAAPIVDAALLASTCHANDAPRRRGGRPPTADHRGDERAIAARRASCAPALRPSCDQQAAQQRPAATCASGSENPSASGGV